MVVDASVVLSWFLPNEGSPYTAALLEEIRAGAHAPALLQWEVENALLMAERRGRIDLSSARELLEAFRALPIEKFVPPAGSAFALAREFNLSAYDASYLWLALERGSTLATVDVRLQKAAVKLGVFHEPKPA